MAVFLCFATAVLVVSGSSPKKPLGGGGRTDAVRDAGSFGPGASLSIVRFAARELSANDAQIHHADGAAASGNHLSPDWTRMLLRKLPLYLAFASGRGGRRSPNP